MLHAGEIWTNLIVWSTTRNFELFDKKRQKQKQKTKNKNKSKIIKKTRFLKTIFDKAFTPLWKTLLLAETIVWC